MGTIVKEFCNNSDGRFFYTLRTKSYACSLAHFDILYETAVANLGAIEKSSVSVVMYGDDSHKRTMGIEFILAVSPPNDYAERTFVLSTI